MNEGSEEVKRVMYKWEERNNDNTEENLVFGMTEGNYIRVLGELEGGRKKMQRIE